MTDNDCHDRTSSAPASEVTTLRQYKNVCIIIIIIKYMQNSTEEREIL